MRKNVVSFLALSFSVALCASVGMAAQSVPKPKQIVAFLDTTFLEPQKGQAQFIDEYKKLTGIDLKVIQPVHNQYYEKLRLAFAAGDIPDVVEIADPNYVQYANEGAFVDLNKYVKSSAPLKKVAKTFNGLKIKGKLYGVPTEAANGPITYIRKDWLQNLGLKAPTTWDEFLNVMKAFTLKDPDKNGKNDTYGVTSSGPSGDSSISLASNYYRDFYMNAEPAFTFRRGKWIDGFNQKEMKPALERFRLAYQQKLIDPEIFTNKTSTCREKFCSGKAGIFSYWAGMWQMRLENDLQKNLGDSAKIMPIASLKGSYNVARVPAVNAITVRAKNPEGIFKYFIEFSHDGGKGQMLFVHGVENVHYKKDGAKLDVLPSLDNPEQPFPKAYHAPALAVAPWASGKDPIDMDSRITQSDTLFRATCVYDVCQIFTDSRKKIEEPLNNAKNDCLSKVITGAKTVDQGLAEYKKKYAELKIDQVLADINAQAKK